MSNFDFEIPQMKHWFLISKSFSALTALLSAKASMMIPKKMFSKTMLMTRKKPRSKMYLSL